MVKDLTFPSGFKVFTSDATSLYTMIKTTSALYKIGRYLHQHEARIRHVSTEALSEALVGIILKNNVFKFGDTYWLQKD